jgi:hypothetical protein
MPARDAFEPGPDNTYPAWPRRPDGTLDPERMPTGTHYQRDKSGRRVVVDVTPRKPDGTRIVPPTIPPEGAP